ncbi:hypothetical protein K439DRAFT_68089 [Ramaria rubella]|nr:hypothetical protein K439DRAFT_68089 [Ramaria rubella]
MSKSSSFNFISTSYGSYVVYLCEARCSWSAGIINYANASMYLCIHLRMENKTNSKRGDFDLAVRYYLDSDSDSDPSPNNPSPMDTHAKINIKPLILFNVHSDQGTNEMRDVRCHCRCLCMYMPTDWKPNQNQNQTEKSGLGSCIEYLDYSDSDSDPSSNNLSPLHTYKC